jgi:SNF2 family DNA or RNA helicase
VNKLQLYPHQQKALDDTSDQNRVAYYLDMGLGKTFVGSEKMMQLGSTVNLLICQKSKVNDWIQHFRTYYATHDKDFCCDDLIFDLTNKKQFEGFMTEAKAAVEPNEIYDEWTGQTYQQENLYPYMIIGVINYELTFRRSELLQIEDFTLILDESSMIQNESAKRSKFVLKMEPDNVILLSGTPTAGKYENLYSQLKLLGWKITKELYWKQYVDSEWVENEDGFFRRQVNGYKNVERLKQKLRQHGAVFMKSEEVFDLPDQIFNKVMVPASKEYKKFIRSGIIKIDEKELVGDTILTKRLYSRILCGHYNKDKLDAFKDLLESTNDRLIVFYNFNDELAALAALVEERPISIINGSVKDLKAYEESDDSVTFVQYQAGAMGLNLQKANKVIYFTLPQSSELFEQSKKRTHRIGQNQHCFYYFMMCAGSVEEDILQTLEMRKDYSDDLFKEYESKH